jgi:hypothetical protein
MNFARPCSEESIENLRQRARSVLSFEVPEQYLAFLRVTDGLEWDGLLIYASKSERTLRYQRGVIDGFVEMNDIAQEFDVFQDYIYFAQDGMFLYGYSRSWINMKCRIAHV